jgi:predicted nucleic acid-binding protein
MESRYLILDTNVLVPWFIQLKKPTIEMMELIIPDYTIAISYIGYRELYRTSYKMFLEPKNKIPGNWDQISGRIETFVNSNIFEFFNPYNVIQLKNDPKADKYYQLRKQDYNDLFFLELAIFTSAEFFVTRDLKLLKSIGASETESVKFYETTIIHQTQMMNQLGF